MHYAACLALFIFATPAIAQKAGVAGEPVSGKFKIDGSDLIYDSDEAIGDAIPEITGRDVEDLRAILQANEAIETLQLTSGGGSLWAGKEMAHIVIDYTLDTVVERECSSSCVIVFLAGDSRIMTGGSKLGFHLNSWSAEGLQSYYKGWREDQGWDTPYDFGSWLYRDVQIETHAELTYMIERGVDPAFAIETKRARGAMWFPRREELEAAGVLRE